MKVLISIAFFGVILSELCNAQTLTCTSEEIQALTVTFNNCDPACLGTVCDCCTQALNAGSSDKNYNCCSAYSELMQCASNTTGIDVVPCPTLPAGESNGDSGASTATAVRVISGMMILASSVVNQLIL